MEDPQIQYSYRWGNSAYTPWVDVGEEAEVEVHAGFFMKARIKPERCHAQIEHDRSMIECERLDHSGPGQDPVHEGIIPEDPTGHVIRWTSPTTRMFPTWDGRSPEGR